jgi:transcriptional regulator with XRE-family HTH domain
MSPISVPVFTRRLREVVADEPKAFAYDVGLSLSAVYNYLNGRVPATDVLFRIARYAGRPMEWFLVDDEAAIAAGAPPLYTIDEPLRYVAAGREGT